MARSVPRTHRVFLETYGSGPWPCSFCDELVTSIGRRTGHVHHRDEDPENDAPENLAIAHPGCHMRHHLEGVPHSPEHSSKVGRKGRKFTPEWRAKLSARQRTRVRCSSCGYTSSPQHVGRHEKAVHG